MLIAFAAGLVVFCLALSVAVCRSADRADRELGLK